VLTGQHRRLERLLKTLADAEMGEERSELLARAGDELAVHLLAEERLVYPRVHRSGTEDVLLESLEEHLSLKRLLADLLALAPEASTFQAKCKVLDEQARHHHGEEEEHLFPAMRRLLDDGERRAMGAAVKEHEAGLRRRGAPRQLLDEQTDAAAPLP
jgi:hemerythrin superfamily protein